MNRIHIYCDGGCRGNQTDNNVGAWGVYIQHKERVIELGGYETDTTNNQMELRAPIEALKVIKKKDVPITMYFDSAYVLNGITSWVQGWKRNGWLNSSKKPVKNKELWVELDNLINQFSNIKLVKVKGHSDNFGNIQADRICNEYMDKFQNQTI